MEHIYLSAIGIHCSIVGGFLHISDELSRAVGDPRSWLAIVFLYGGLCLTLASVGLYLRSRV